jgi:hypothetical protein
MTRAALKKMLGTHQQSVIPPELIENPLLRRILAASEKYRSEYEAAKAKIYADRTLTDDGRSKAFGKAFDRYMRGFERVGDLQRRYDRKYELPRLKEMAARRKAAAGRA